MTHKILPVEEFVAPDEFTNRVAELTYLQEWVQNISQGKSNSLALISPRRLGKTALLERLVNTVFFEDWGVAPFYYSRGRGITTLRKFLLDYATVFYRQYIAYLLQEPRLYRDRSMNLHLLSQLTTADERIGLIQEKFITPFLARYESGNEPAEMLWTLMVHTPEDVAVSTGVKVAILIDEFQDLKTQIYDAPESLIIDPKRHQPVDIPATFSRQSQSRQAPMLVSGSAVTMIFNTTMGGPLGGRFSFRYLKPMSTEDGAQLVKKLIPPENITDELAHYLSFQLSGHPYYITCCARSRYPLEKFTSRSQIDALIEFELVEGDIGGFWEAHFNENRELINQDDNAELGKKIFYYFTKYNNQKVEIREIAKQLKVPPEIVEEKLEKLHQADLVYRKVPGYYAFNDNMLMRYIYNTASQGVEGIDLPPPRIQGFNNYYKGKLLELLVQNILHSFRGEELPGSLFGTDKTVFAPHFSQVGSISSKLPNSEEYEIDAFGDYLDRGEHVIWVTECKNRIQPVNKQEVERTLRAAAVAQNSFKASRAFIWFVSTAGFTADAKTLLEEHGCYYSANAEINSLAKRYGIPVKIGEKIVD